MKIRSYIISLLSILCIFSTVSLNVFASDGGFGVEDKNGEWKTETHTDIFHTFRYDNNLLYPGAGSTYKFRVYNSGEKYDVCRVEIKDKNKYRIPLEFKLRRNGEYIIGSAEKWVESPVLDTDLYRLRGTDEYELDWRWQYINEDESYRDEANKVDTKLGTDAFYAEEPYYLNITVTGEGGTDDSSTPSEPEPKPSTPEQSTPEPSTPEHEPSTPSTPEPEQSTPSSPSIIDVVLTGDNLWKTCLIIGAVMGISCLVIVITGGKRHGKEE